MSKLADLASQLSPADIFNNLVAAAIWLLLGFLVWASRRGIVFALRWFKVGAIWRIIPLSLAALATLYWASGPTHPWAFVGAALAIIAIPIYSLWGFQTLGLIDAHVTTRGGIDYRSSLRMASRSIDFLGVGADKLTGLPEFEEAMDRCATGGRRVRLLLSAPDNPLLSKMAKRLGQDPLEFGTRVRESLRRIHLMIENKQFDIEVRFYPHNQDRDLQQFRLMFIDDSICLWGWTVWGKHIGKENPQLVLKNYPHRRPPNAAYRAFADYFDTLWEASAREDLSKYG